MKKGAIAAIGALIVSLLATNFASSAPRSQRAAERLQMYTVTVAPEQVGALRAQGYDLINPRGIKKSALQADLVLSPTQAAQLQPKVIALRVWRNEEGKRPLSWRVSKPKTASRCGVPTMSRAASKMRSDRWPRTTATSSS